MQEKIEELILTNIQLWHEVTKVKDLKGELRKKSSLSLEDRVKCTLRIRELNAHRSKLRWDIDKYFGDGTNETKIFTGKK